MKKFILFLIVLLGVMTCNAQIRAFVSPITRTTAYNWENKTVIANDVKQDSLAILWDVDNKIFYVRELEQSFKWYACEATSINDLSATRFFCDDWVSFVYTREVAGGRVKRIHLIIEKAFEDGHSLLISGEWEEIVVDNSH